MACLLIFVSAKFCYTACQLKFDFDFYPNQNFVPVCQLDILFLCLYVSVLCLPKRRHFVRFSWEHEAGAERETANN